jgi:hypothetical protein
VQGVSRDLPGEPAEPAADHQLVLVDEGLQRPVQFAFAPRPTRQFLSSAA